MADLFSTDSIFPEGFSYFPGFITEEEERLLCENISNLHLTTFIFRGYEARRKVASFGFDYHFDSRSISKGSAIPGEFHFLVEKISSFLNIPISEFAEVLVTEYPAGSVINWHRDAPPFKLIAGISLLSDCNLNCARMIKQNRAGSQLFLFL
jgi:alkylated DNA repair dioxygenase AlkB